MYRVARGYALFAWKGINDLREGRLFLVREIVEDPAYRHGLASDKFYYMIVDDRGTVFRAHTAQFNHNNFENRFEKVY